MRTLFTIACLAFSILPSFGAAFPYITLNTHTNRLSDNGTNLTYNGSALAGGGANWTASGSTNSTLPGTASANAGIFTNSLTVNGEVALNRGNLDGVMIGNQAGLNDASSDNIDIGSFAGEFGTNSVSSVRIGRHAGWEAHGNGAVQIGHAAGQYAHDSGGAVLLGYLSGRFPDHNFNAIQIGQSAAEYATNSQGSVMIGYLAGHLATDSVDSVMMGDSAGYQAASCGSCVFIGPYAGYGGSSTVGSIFLGYHAGASISGFNGNHAVMIGESAGQTSTTAEKSIYIGYSAGNGVNRDSTLIIDGNATYSTTTNALIYGELDNRYLAINGTMLIRSNITVAGLMIPSVDNAINIGATGGHLYSSINAYTLNGYSTVVSSGPITLAATRYLNWSGRATMFSPSDGVITLGNFAEPPTDFNRLQFGGTNSSFPSIKRSTTGLISRLADDSADTWHQAKQYVISGTTNQVVFGGTNAAPSTPATPATWISVQVTGDTNIYSLPLYK